MASAHADRKRTKGCVDIAGWKRVPAGFLIAFVAAGALLPLGCATGSNRENVWVQIIPGRFYSFHGVKGEADGETLYIKGRMDAVGHFDPGYVPYIVEGRTPGNEVKVKKEGGRWMKGRSEVFFTEVPYEQGLDYTIRPGREGLLSSD